MGDMMHISIEGMDGVGKSTIGSLLATILGFKFIDKPLRFLFSENGDPDEYIRIRDYVNSSQDRKFTSWFYGLGNIFLYEKFGNDDIITDRHLLSNFQWSGTDDNEIVYDALVKMIGAPSFTFLLYANEASIRRRLINRDESDSDLEKVKFTESAYKKMESFLIQYKMPYAIIDSSSMKPEDICNKMVEILKERGII